MIAVAIPTRDRPGHVRTCVASVLAGDEQPDEILVVDQSAGDETRAALAELGTDRLRYVRAERPGTSAARNTAGELAAAEYVAFLDDDVTVPPGWLATVIEEIDRHGRPDALFGEMRAPDGQVDAKGLTVSTFSVPKTAVWSGITPPNRLGFGAHAVLRRDALLAVGGFDTRLGPGTRCYSAEDIDLNYRLLRAGASIVTSSRIWVVHHQWRPASAIPRHFYRYNVGHSVFCMKHLLEGDRYPLRLVAVQALGDLKMLASAVRRRSFLRARASLFRAAGTWHGLARGWAVFRH
jgi:GT2 family glycosyltransferase